MIHIGESEFYDEIHWEQLCCDTVLMEGAAGWPAKLANHLYGYVANLKHIALTRQGENWTKNKRDVGKWSRPNPDAPFETTITAARYHGIECLPKRVRFVRADLDGRQTRSILKRIPVMTWLLLAAGAIVAMFLALVTSRKEIIEDVSEAVNDRQYEISSFPERYLKHFEEYVLDARDAYLSQILIREIQQAKGKRRVIGVCYGAGHMEKLHRQLAYDLGYRKPEQREVLVLAARKNHIGSPEDGYGFANKAFRELANLQFMPRQTNWVKRLPKTRKKKGVPVKGPRIRFNYSLQAPPEFEWKQKVSAILGETKADEAA